MWSCGIKDRKGRELARLRVRLGKSCRSPREQDLEIGGNCSQVNALERRTVKFRRGSELRGPAPFSRASSQLQNVVQRLAGARGVTGGRPPHPASVQPPTPEPTTHLPPSPPAAHRTQLPTGDAPSRGRSALRPVPDPRAPRSFCTVRLLQGPQHP